MTFAHRYVGADSLPARLSEFDVEQYFTLTKADVSALCERFRADRRVPAARLLLHLRASGRPLDRVAVVPKNLLRTVRDALGAPTLTIASAVAQPASPYPLRASALGQRPPGRGWCGCWGEP